MNNKQVLIVIGSAFGLLASAWAIRKLMENDDIRESLQRFRKDNSEDSPRLTLAADIEGS